MIKIFEMVVLFLITVFLVNIEKIFNFEPIFFLTFFFIFSYFQLLSHFMLTEVFTVSSNILYTSIAHACVCIFPKQLHRCSAKEHLRMRQIPDCNLDAA